MNKVAKRRHMGRHLAYSGNPELVVVPGKAGPSVFMYEYDLDNLAHENELRQRFITAHLTSILRAQMSHVMFLGWVREPKLFVSRVKQNRQDDKLLMLSSVLEEDCGVTSSIEYDTPGKYGHGLTVGEKKRVIAAANRPLVFGGAQIPTSRIVHTQSGHEIINYRQTLARFLRELTRD